MEAQIQLWKGAEVLYIYRNKRLGSRPTSDNFCVIASLIIWIKAFDRAYVPWFSHICSLVHQPGGGSNPAPDFSTYRIPPVVIAIS